MQYNGELCTDATRGVLWFNDDQGMCRLRICGLPKDKIERFVMVASMIDITIVRGHGNISGVIVDINRSLGDPPKTTFLEDLQYILDEEIHVELWYSGAVLTENKTHKFGSLEETVRHVAALLRAEQK